MDVSKLLKDELCYELRIRGRDGDDDILLLRKRLAETLDENIHPKPEIIQTLDHEQEYEICRNKYGSLLERVEELEDCLKEFLCLDTRLTHLSLRVRNIPTNDKVNKLSFWVAALTDVLWGKYPGPIVVSGPLKTTDSSWTAKSDSGRRNSLPMDYTDPLQSFSEVICTQLTVDRNTDDVAVGASKVSLVGSELKVKHAFGKDIENNIFRDDLNQITSTGNGKYLKSLNAEESDNMFVVTDLIVDGSNSAFNHVNNCYLNLIEARDFDQHTISRNEILILMDRMDGKLDIIYRTSDNSKRNIFELHIVVRTPQAARHMEERNPG